MDYYGMFGKFTEVYGSFSTNENHPFEKTPYPHILTEDIDT